MEIRGNQKLSASSTHAASIVNLLCVTAPEPAMPTEFGMKSTAGINAHRECSQELTHLPQARPNQGETLLVHWPTWAPGPHPCHIPVAPELRLAILGSNVYNNKHNGSPVLDNEICSRVSSISNI